MKRNAVTGKTGVCAIIGDPIEHSMSPVIHNAAFAELGLDYIFVAFRVRKEELGEAVRGVRTLNIRGLSVTIPHKVSIIPFLDKLDPLAERVGAVSAVVNDDGVLTGYNTDGTGFLQSMLERGIEPEGKNIVVLGAGGASRSISFILAERGARLTIINRKLEFDWAVSLAQRISQAFGKEVKALELSEANLAAALDNAEILVNTTSVGMSPDNNGTLVPKRLLRPDLAVLEVIFNPIKTRLLREAEEVGAPTVDGLNMLVWQGIMVFEMWTGHKAPLDLMRSEATKVLEEHG